MTGKRAISTVNRSSELICHWVDLWCAIDFVNLILFRLLSNGFGVLISRFESQWNMNGSSSSFMFMLKLENTYVSPATGFSSLRAEIGQEKRFFVILKAENFITRYISRPERKPFVNSFHAFVYDKRKLCYGFWPWSLLDKKVINVFTLS